MVEIGLLSYLPSHVLQSIIDNEDVLGVERRMRVVTLFADVSGFTAISEALGKTGKSGAEELVRILNSYFDPMIALVRTYGGIIGKFGGDAMTVLFPYDDNTVSDVVRRAVQCAVDMQNRMSDYIDIPTSVGKYSLAMKAGLAMGEVLTLTVGIVGQRLEYIIAGEPVDLCADAEHHAEKGDIVLHNHLLKYTGGVEKVREFDGFTQIRRLHNTATIIVAPKMPDLPPSRQKTVKDYIPPLIAQRILEGRSNFIGEHRLVTVLFVSFSTFDYDNDLKVGERLQAYLADVIDIIYRYDGTLNKVDMGDKGSKYIILFGAPIAHEDDEVRALRCALELSQLDIPSRIGVNSGFVFCGEVGSSIRQEYTVMGDAVNLAARLMQFAQSGQIIVSDSTYRPVSDNFLWADAQSITVKGKTEPITIRRLAGNRKSQTAYYHEIQYPYPMVGRESEKQRALEVIKAVVAGDGQITGISGAAGTGKSRLTAYMIEQARRANMRIVGGECESFGTNTSYLVWHSIWRGLFDIPSEGTPKEQLKALQSSLQRINPRLIPRMPLLAPIINLTIDDNELTNSLDTKTRLDLTFSLLLQCLRSLAKDQSLLIILEDCHWMDPISQQLLEFLGRNITDLPVWMLMVYRQEGAMISGLPLRQVIGYTHFHDMPLDELSTTDAESLMRHKLQVLTSQDDNQISPELMQQIMTKAQGNPFYIEEIVNYIYDTADDISTIKEMDLPATLHSLIISRIDSLTEAEQTTVKVASVIGRFFNADWTWLVYPQLGDAKTVSGYLNKLDRLDITPMHNIENSEYMFKHITTHEVAYDSLAFSTREMLHERVGDFIENTFANQLEQYVDSLAHHYSHSPNEHKKRQYLLSAARNAQSIYANDAAIDYFRRVLPTLDGKEKATALYELGEVLQRVGQWDEAQQHYHDAHALAESNDDSFTLARAKDALGMLFAHTESPDVAMPWLDSALSLFASLKKEREQVNTIRNMGLLYLRQGQFDRALTYFERVSTFDDPQGEVEALLGRGYAHARQGKIDDTMADFKQAVKLATDIDYKQGMYAANNDMAGLSFMRGEVEDAITYCNSALTVATEIGLIQAIGDIIGNVGEIYRLRGENKRAIACYAYAIRNALDQGNLDGLFIPLGNLASVLLETKDNPTAQNAIALAIQIGEQLNATYELCEYLHTQTQIAFYQGDVTTALDVNMRALDMAESVGNEEVAFQARIWRWKLLAEDGSKARSVNGLVKLLQSDSPPEQAAHVCLAIWQLDAKREDMRQRAGTLFRQLYQETPNAIYRNAYHALTGESLPPPPALPALQIDTSEVISVNSLLTQIKQQLRDPDNNA